MISIKEIIFKADIDFKQKTFKLIFHFVTQLFKYTYPEPGFEQDKGRQL